MNNQIKMNEINVNELFIGIEPYLGGLCGLGCGNAGQGCGLFCSKD